MFTGLNIILFATGSIIILGFLYATWVLLKEKEGRASVVSFLTGIIISVPFFVFAIINFEGADYVRLGLMLILALILLLLFFPLRPKLVAKSEPKNRIDERIIMFSRRLYKPGSERYQEFYKEFPEMENPDLAFRAKPGLMAKGSVYFNDVSFRAAAASFDAVETFHDKVDGTPAPEKVEVDPGQISSFIKNWSKKLGAIDSGITTMKDYHWYSIIGRGKDFGKKVELDHPFGIAVTVEMDKEMMDAAPKGPTLMESAQQYLESGTIAIQLALFIRSMGYEARAHIDGNYRVVCPLVAMDAGLGEIGRMGLLMTPKLGPRVRIAVVTTDMPLLADPPKSDPSMIDFCGICKKCADICPSRAISFDDRKLIDGVNRWQIDQEKCFTLWCTAGTDCGLCMKVCPYSHPDNALHNFIRFGIRNNPLFRKLALKLDDVFYGKKPKPKPPPDWIPS